MATSWKRDTHSVNRMIMSCLVLVVSHFDLEGCTVVLVAPVPEHCLQFTLKISCTAAVLYHYLVSRAIIIAFVP